MPNLACGLEFWVPDEHRPQCSLCQSLFGMLNRRSHCRQCGEVFCGACTAFDLELVDIVGSQLGRQKVCRECYGASVSASSPDGSASGGEVAARRRRSAKAKRQERIPGNYADDYQETYAAVLRTQQPAVAPEPEPEPEHVREMHPDSATALAASTEEPGLSLATAIVGAGDAADIAIGQDGSLSLQPHSMSSKKPRMRTSHQLLVELADTIGAQGFKDVMRAAFLAEHGTSTDSSDFETQIEFLAELGQLLSAFDANQKPLLLSGLSELLREATKQRRQWELLPVEDALEPWLASFGFGLPFIVMFSEAFDAVSTEATTIIENMVQAQRQPSPPRKKPVPIQLGEKVTVALPELPSFGEGSAGAALEGPSSSRPLPPPPPPPAFAGTGTDRGGPPPTVEHLDGEIGQLQQWAEIYLPNLAAIPGVQDVAPPPPQPTADSGSSSGRKAIVIDGLGALPELPKVPV